MRIHSKIILVCLSAVMMNLFACRATLHEPLKDEESNKNNSTSEPVSSVGDSTNLAEITCPYGWEDFGPATGYCSYAFRGGGLNPDRLNVCTCYFRGVWDEPNTCPAPSSPYGGNIVCREKKIELPDISSDSQCVTACHDYNNLYHPVQETITIRCCKVKLGVGDM